MSCGLCERDVYGDAIAYLCPGCTALTTERLAELPALYAELGQHLAPGGRRPDVGGSRRTEAPMPVSEPVLDLRGPGGVVSIAEDWRSMLHADLAWTQPAIHGTYEQRLGRAVRGLTDNVLWIASSWPAAGTFAAEMRDLVKAVRSITDPEDPADRPRRLGRCTALLIGGRPCGSAVRLMPGTTTPRCAWCRTEYPPATWAGLRAAQPNLEEAS